MTTTTDMWICPACGDTEPVEPRTHLESTLYMCDTCGAMCERLNDNGDVVLSEEEPA
jgi:hypothetical protein